MALNMKDGIILWVKINISVKSHFKTMSRIQLLEKLTFFFFAFRIKSTVCEKHKENAYCCFSYRTFLVKRCPPSLHLTVVSSTLSFHYPLLANIALSIIKATECQLETAMKTHIHTKRFSTFVKLLITHTQKKELSSPSLSTPLSLPFSNDRSNFIETLLLGYHTTVRSLWESEPQRASLRRWQTISTSYVSISSQRTLFSLWQLQGTSLSLLSLLCEGASLTTVKWTPNCQLEAGTH